MAAAAPSAAAWCSAVRPTQRSVAHGSAPCRGCETACAGGHEGDQGICLNNCAAARVRDRTARRRTRGGQQPHAHLHCVAARKQRPCCPGMHPPMQPLQSIGRCNAPRTISIAGGSTLSKKDRTQHAFHRPLSSRSHSPMPTAAPPRQGCQPGRRTSREYGLRERGQGDTESEAQQPE